MHPIRAPVQRMTASPIQRRTTQAVLRSVHFRRAESILPQLELFAQGTEPGQGSNRNCHRRMGLERYNHLPVGISVHRYKLQRLRTDLPGYFGTAPACPSPANPAVGLQSYSGDYNADGNNLDYPDATSYSQLHDNKAWLTGAVPKSNFATSCLGQEGNEKPMQFRGPNFFETNTNVYKDTPITERVNFQIRFEFFNLFNRANYANVDTNFRTEASVLPPVRMSRGSGSSAEDSRSDKPLLMSVAGQLIQLAGPFFLSNIDSQMHRIIAGNHARLFLHI